MEPNVLCLMVHLMMYCVGIIIGTPEVIGRGKRLSHRNRRPIGRLSLAAEKIYSQDLCILDVRLDTHDGSPALQRFTESLGKKVHQSIK